MATEKETQQQWALKLAQWQCWTDSILFHMPWKNATNRISLTMQIHTNLEFGLLWFVWHKTYGDLYMKSYKITRVYSCSCLASCTITKIKHLLLHYENFLNGIAGRYMWHRITNKTVWKTADLQIHLLTQQNWCSLLHLPSKRSLSRQSKKVKAAGKKIVNNLSWTWK